MDLTQVIIKPHITEKSLKDASLGWFTFIIKNKATKGEVKNAVENQFKVKVLAVKTVITKGKSKRVGKKRQEVKESPRKKARVLLPEGQKIDLFEVGK